MCSKVCTGGGHFEKVGVDVVGKEDVTRSGVTAGTTNDGRELSLLVSSCITTVCPLNASGKGPPYQ